MKFSIMLAAAALSATACERQQPSATQTNGPAAGQGGQIAQTYDGTGTVTAIAGDQITISHGPIVGLKWPAMTMAFTAPPGVGQGVEIESDVSFAFRQDGSTYVLTRLDKR